MGWKDKKALFEAFMSIQTHPLSKRLACVFIIILNLWTTNDNTLVNT